MCTACGRKYRSPQARAANASALKNSSPSAGADTIPAPVAKRQPSLRYPRWRGGKRPVVPARNIKKEE